MTMPSKSGAILSKESASFLEVASGNEEDSTGETIAKSTTSSSSFSLAREETKMVQQVKKIVVFVILLVACLIGVACFIMLRNQETEAYESQVSQGH